tara:strand:+ start:316 stop:519 length:204 start_codon:yes stop_codon:yes gene_type:complete
MNEQEKSLLIEQLSNINKNLITHNQIMSVFLKFALDSSSFKSKTINEIKASTKKQNEILKAIHESNF